jgi:DNA-binding transcriptional ArsR family regulator
MTTDYQSEAQLFKALGDENRLRILSLLTNGEVCACKLLEALSIGQSTLSHHMRILCDAGVVCARRDGKWMRVFRRAGRRQPRDEGSDGVNAGGRNLKRTPAAPAAGAFYRRPPRRTD